MKKISLVAACVGLGLVAVCHAQNVAVVNMEDLVSYHPNTVSDKKLLAETRKDYMKQGDDLQRNLKAMNEDFDKARRDALDPALNDKARKAAEENVAKLHSALESAINDARETMQKLQQDLSEQQTRMLKRTVNEIRDAVAKYAAEKKISVVLADNQLVYFDKKLDITDDIMKALNIHRPEKTDDAKGDAADMLSLPPVKSAADKPASGATK